jgi:asparagine synthase (glutamine-hydrolysing)
MLALACPWTSGEHKGQQKLAARLASSLCAGIGGHAGSAEIAGIHFAYRSLRSTEAFSRAWRPPPLPSGRIVVFHGYFDNAAEIASALKVESRDCSVLYGLAVERWADEAEKHIIGNYCAVIVDPTSSSLRLSRSPIRAPPLYYHHNDQLTAAASVPRALFSAGAPQQLNESNYADLAFFNFSDREASCFKEIFRVPLGCIVELQRGKAREIREAYDVLDIRLRPVPSDAEAIRKAGELLDEGVRACLAGFSKPGATLSSGLDSPQVAVRALACLPERQKLPTFTFHPKSGFDRAPRWKNGDERPMVEAFAALHPGLEPHFTSNDGYDPLYRLTEMFHLAGCAAPYQGTMYVFHGILAEASKQSCDVLLLADNGNRTFSDKGLNGFVEYFLKGRWRQLWLALTRPAIHQGGVTQRLVVRTLSAFLPLSAWRVLRPLLTKRSHLIELMQPFSAAFLSSSGARERVNKSGRFPGRHQPWSRRHLRKFLFDDEDWLADVYQAFEQMYGIALRDPTAYRPFVEYCLSLPTKMFMRDGELRWLARQMAKGIMPEEQRVNELDGYWDTDWRIRLGPRRKEFLDELKRLEEDDRIGPMLDLPRLRAALEDWPAEGETDHQKTHGPALAVPAALLTARFIQYVEGRNTPDPRASGAEGR